MKITTLIKKAGGELHLANEFNFKTTQAVYYWRKRGIPEKYHERIALMAEVTLSVVQKATPDQPKNTP